MFCEKCGSVIGENGICPNCNSTQFNQQSLLNTTSISIEKCVWFAPVSVIVIKLVVGIISIVINSISATVSTNYLMDYSFKHLGVSNLFSGLNSIISLAVTVGFAILFYNLAFKERKNEHKVLILVPVASIFVGNMLSSFIYGVLTGLLTMIFVNMSSPQYSIIVSVISIVSGIVATIVSAVLAFLVAKKYSNKATK